MSDKKSGINLERLKNLIDKEKSRQVIASKMGCDVSLITKHYNGDRIITVDCLYKYAKCFGVSADYLLGLTDAPVALDTDEQKTIRAASDYTGFRSSYIELVNTIKKHNAITIIDLTERLTEELIINFRLVDDLANGKTQHPFNFLDIINDSVAINSMSKKDLEKILNSGERDISQYIAHVTIIKSCIEKTIDEYFEIEDINKYYNEFLTKKQNILESYNGGENDETEEKKT